MQESDAQRFKRTIALNQTPPDLSLQAAALEYHMQHLSLASICIDGSRCIRRQNNCAHLLMSERWHMLIVRHNKLHHAESRWDKILQQAISRVLVNGTPHFIELGSDINTRMKLTLAPITDSSWIDREQSGALLLISCGRLDMERQRQTLSERYELTQSEINVALRLLSGCEQKKISAELGITYETARTYAKRVYQKCAVKSQAQLILLLRS